MKCEFKIAPYSKLSTFKVRGGRAHTMLMCTVAGPFNSCHQLCIKIFIAVSRLSHSLGCTFIWIKTKYWKILFNSFVPSISISISSIAFNMRGERPIYTYIVDRRQMNFVCPLEWVKFPKFFFKKMVSINNNLPTRSISGIFGTRNPFLKTDSSYWSGLSGCPFGRVIRAHFIRICVTRELCATTMTSLLSNDDDYRVQKEKKESNDGANKMK